jgi:hypothetical protein
VGVQEDSKESILVSMYHLIVDNVFYILVELIGSNISGGKMQKLTRVSVLITILVSVCLPGYAFPLNSVNADDSSQNFVTRALDIYQSGKQAVSHWDSNYSFQSPEDLETGVGSGLATSGTYSNTVPGATLKTEELPYFGHSGIDASV